MYHTSLLLTGLTTYTTFRTFLTTFSFFVFVSAFVRCFRFHPFPLNSLPPDCRELRPYLICVTFLTELQTNSGCKIWRPGFQFCFEYEIVYFSPISHLRTFWIHSKCICRYAIQWPCVYIFINANDYGVSYHGNITASHLNHHLLITSSHTL